MKQILLYFALLLSVHLNAQNTYTEKLRQNETGKGTIIINQSKEIEDIVNGKQKQPSMSPKKQTADDHKTAAKPATTKPNMNKATKTDASPSHATNDVSKSKETKATEKNETGKANHNFVSRARHKARGFRICIFTGGNSRADKQKAIEMGKKCRAKFKELAAYPSFEAPRWVTHVGDFKTKQEAQKYVTLIRRSHITYEVRIVASEVNIPY